jgi:hypothetical protein
MRSEMARSQADVIVVGAGNAAFCAALAAQEQGASVLMLEAAPEEESGGNSRFTAGSVRMVYNGVDDIKALVPDLTDQEIATTDFGTYTQEQFFDDMARVTQNRADPDLVELLVTRSFNTFCWMRDKGVRFIPIYGRQAFKIADKFKFWGGLTVEAVGGGPGLIKMLTSCGANRSCSHAAASNRIPSGAPVTLGPAGTSPRCAARASTRATASAWRWISARAPAGTGPAVTRCNGR